MSTYVLIHGGSHGGWCYDKVAPLLRQAGHEVFAPTLTGLGDRKHLLSPAINLETHHIDVANLLYYHNLRNVILVGHSYGGIVIPGVADRALDRVGKLVYLDAVRPRNGEALVDYVPAPAAEMMRQSMQVIDGVELVNFPSEAGLRAYGVTDQADIDWALPRLTAHPWATCLQKLTLRNPEAVEAIHKVGINCELSITNRTRGFTERVFEADQLFVIEGAAHDVMITHPREVADVLLQLA